MNQPQPGHYPQQPGPYAHPAYPSPPQRSGPNTALVVALVVVLMTLAFVLVFFLFLQDSDDDSSPTVAPATTVATTVPPASGLGTTTAPPVASTAPPTTALALAPCVNGEINASTTGRRGEIALYQTTLKNLGFDPGEIDGFFGPNTQRAASDEVFANGNINGPDGAFAEIFPDDGAFLPAVFVRLGIACP